jgi:glycosyltransferase involved in cell wall biosynthesis
MWNYAINDIMIYELKCSQEPLISIVTPTLNAENYIEEYWRYIEMLRRIMPIEIVIIDGDSYDKTTELLLARAKDSKVCGRIITGKYNVSQARNIGMQISDGLYVYFLDVDDIPVTRTFNMISRIIYDKKPQVIVGNWLIYHEELGKLKKVHMFNRHGIMKGSEVLYEWLNSVCNDHLDLRLQNSLFERSFLIRNHLKFHDEAISHEDFEFLANVLSKADQVVKLPEYIAIHKYRASRSVNARRVLNGLRTLKRAFTNIGEGTLKEAYILQDISSLLSYYDYHRKQGCLGSSKDLDLALLRIIRNKHDEFLRLYVEYIKTLLSYCFIERKIYSYKAVTKLLRKLILLFQYSLRSR